MTMYDYVGICRNIYEHFWACMTLYEGERERKERERTSAILKKFHSFKLLEFFKQNTLFHMI